jgi:hypothetical protein
VWQIPGGRQMEIILIDTQLVSTKEVALRTSQAPHACQTGFLVLPATYPVAGCDARAIDAALAFKRTERT